MKLNRKDFIAGLALGTLTGPNLHICNLRSTETRRKAMKNKLSLFLMSIGIAVVAFAASDIAWKYDTSAREQSVPVPVVVESSATAVNTVACSAATGTTFLADGCFRMFSNEATAGNVISLYAPGFLFFLR